MQFETGGYQISDAVLMLVEVSEVKTVPHDPPTRYVVVDGSMMMFVARGMMRVGHPVVPVVEPLRDAIAVSTDVVGQTCVYDSVAENIQLPELAAGDLLAFLQQGAYCETESTQFNGFPRPEVVLLHDGRASIVKRRETIADVRARDVVPPELWPGLTPEPEVAARIVAQVDELVGELVAGRLGGRADPQHHAALPGPGLRRARRRRGARLALRRRRVPRAPAPRSTCSRLEEGRENAVGVVARSGGGRSLIFNGHVDVVPPGDARTGAAAVPGAGSSRTAASGAAAPAT